MRDQMLVADVMTFRPTTVTPDATLKEAVALMIKGGFRRLPVVDEMGLLIGMVTDRDIRLAADSPILPHSQSDHEQHITHITVESCMTTDVITVETKTPAADAIILMQKHGISGLPIMLGHEVVGIVTVTDMLNAFLAALQKAGSVEALVAWA